MKEHSAFRDIRISGTAKSKCYRMFRSHQIRQRVRECAGQLYQKGSSNEYHLLTEPLIDEEDWRGNDWVIAFAVKDDHVVVITQMHEHFDYDADKIYQPVEDPTVHLREKEPQLAV